MTDFANFLGAAYPWVKAAHVTFVIFWMAGLFLLPRFFVYHQETVVGSPEDRAWIEREARVRSIILTPAIGLVWLLGLLLAVNITAWHQGWFMAKFVLVVALSAYQGWLGSYARKLAAGQRPLSGRSVRMINEVPGIAAALIVVLAIVKPF